MSGALSRTGGYNGPVRRAIKKLSRAFDGIIQVLCVKTTDGAWVQFSPIVDVVGQEAAYLLRVCRVPIAVDLGGGKEVVEAFVSRAEFYGAAVVSQRNPSFRNFVIAILEELEDKGFVVASPDSNHHLVVQAKVALGMALELAEHERQLAEHDRRLVDVEATQESLCLGQKALEGHVASVADLIRHGQQYGLASVALQQKGIKIPVAMRSKVGKEIASIGRSLGYPVDSYPNGRNSPGPAVPFGGFFPLFYPRAVLERIIAVWIEDARKDKDKAALLRDLRQ